MGILAGKIQKIRIDKASPYIKGDVLDIGCGQKIPIFNMYKDRIKSYCGVDRFLDIKKIKSKYPEGKFFSKNLDKEELNIPKKFDCILLVALVEHIFNQKFLFEEVVKHLKDDGRIVVTTPTVFGNDVVHRIGVRLGLFCKSARDDHIVIYNKKRFETLAKEMDLQIDTHKLFELGCNQLVVLSKYKN